MRTSLSVSLLLLLCVCLSVQKEMETKNSHHHSRDGTTQGTTSGYVDNWSIGQWTHLSCSFDGTNLAVYKDGLLIATSQSSCGMTTMSENWVLGSTVGSASVVSAVSEFRIWNTPRSSLELRSCMNQHLEGDEEGLVGYFKLNEGSGLIAWNSVPNSTSIGSLAGAASWFVFGCSPPSNQEWQCFFGFGYFLSSKSYRPSPLFVSFDFFCVGDHLQGHGRSL